MPGKVLYFTYSVTCILWSHGWIDCAKNLKIELQLWWNIKTSSASSCQLGIAHTIVLISLNFFLAVCTKQQQISHHSSTELTIVMQDNWCLYPEDLVAGCRSWYAWQFVQWQPATLDYLVRYKNILYFVESEHLFCFASQVMKLEDF